MAGTDRKAGPGNLAGAPHEVDHMVRALGALQHLKANGRVKGSAGATLRFMYPDSLEARLAQLRGNGFREVSRNRLHDFRVRFNVACVLAPRQWYRSNVSVGRCQPAAQPELRSIPVSGEAGPQGTGGRPGTGRRAGS